jgi:hypothetical protein
VHDRQPTKPPNFTNLGKKKHKQTNKQTLCGPFSFRSYCSFRVLSPMVPKTLPRMSLELFNEKNCVYYGRTLILKRRFPKKTNTAPPLPTPRHKPPPGATGTGRCVGMRTIRTTSVASVSIFRVAASAAPKRWPTHQTRSPKPMQYPSIHLCTDSFIHVFIDSFKFIIHNSYLAHCLLHPSNHSSIHISMDQPNSLISVGSETSSLFLCIQKICPFFLTPSVPLQTTVYRQGS